MTMHVATGARVGGTDWKQNLGKLMPWMQVLRARWPSNPTTGWDHWIRLSESMDGRECIAPEVRLVWEIRWEIRWLVW